MPAAALDSTEVPSTQRLFFTAAVIAAATIFGLTCSPAAPLIALDLNRLGYSATLISANATMHALPRASADNDVAGYFRRARPRWSARAAIRSRGWLRSCANTPRRWDGLRGWRPTMRARRASRSIRRPPDSSRRLALR